MFNNNADITPRTYSIKSYKKRDSLTFGKLMKYIIIVLVLALISGITFLSMNHII